MNPNGTLACDLDTGATAVAGVFAGGDAATGPDTVIAAVASGRKAAASIDAYLTNGEPFLAYDPELTEVSKKQVLARQKGLELEPGAAADAAGTRAHGGFRSPTGRR